MSIQESKSEYSVLVHHEDGSYWAEVKELPGCFAAGDTLDELWEGLTEAIGMYLSTPESQVSVHVAEREVVSESVEAKVLICS